MANNASDGAASIREWLDLKMVTGRYSGGLVSELVHHMEHRTAHVFSILDEIGDLEGSPNSRGRNTKPAGPFKGALLAGLWHKHYFQASFLPKNIETYWKSGEFPDRIKAILGDLKHLTQQKAGQIAHAYVMDGYRERSQSGEITGEWIIFARQNDVNYYLTLGSHTEGDEAIRQRVLACCAEFPNLLICQGSEG